MSDESGLITKATVAAMLAVTPRQVERYMADSEDSLPIAERAPKGSKRGHRFDIRAVHEWAVRRIIAEAPEGELDLSQERAKLAKVQRERQEIAAARERGEVAPIAVVQKLVTDDYANVRARLLAMPSKLAPLVVPLTEPAEARELIEDHIIEALDELSSPEQLSKGNDHE